MRPLPPPDTPQERARLAKETRAVACEKLRQRREEENRRRTSMAMTTTKARLRLLLKATAAVCKGVTSIDDRNQRLLVWLEAACNAESQWQMLKFLEQVERIIAREPAPRGGPEDTIPISSLTGRVAQMLEPGRDEKEDEDEEHQETIAG